MTERAGLDLSHAELRPVPGYQTVADFLRREMTLGRIRPGDRLPPERRLAEQLGVSRETLRQALRILEGSGQVVVTRGAAGGAIVRDAVLDPAIIRRDIQARAAEFRALTEYRGVIESAAAGLAAARRTVDDLAAMQRAQDELDAAESKADARAADTAFHLAVARASGNGHLIAAVEEARVRMFEPVDLLAFVFVKPASLDAHGTVLRAIADGDVAAAEAAMRGHLAHSSDELERVIAG